MISCCVARMAPTQNNLVAFALFSDMHGQHFDDIGGGVEAARLFAHLVWQAALAQHAGAFVHFAVVWRRRPVAQGMAFLVSGAQKLVAFQTRRRPGAGGAVRDAE